MEKIIERYTLERVSDVIDKHIRYHESIIMDCKLEALDPDTDTGEKLMEIRDSCSAIASLRMLQRELDGEVGY